MTGRQDKERKEGRKEIMSVQKERNILTGRRDIERKERRKEIYKDRTREILDMKARYRKKERKTKKRGRQLTERKE